MTYQDFKAKYPPGSSNVGTNSTNLGQCAGYIEAYCMYLGIPTINGYAASLFYDNASSNDFDKLPNNAIPKPGDIFVFGTPWAPNPIYNPSAKAPDPRAIRYLGHTGLVDSPQNYPAFMGCEANYSLTGKVEIVFHQNRNGLLGFLRVKKLEDIMDAEDAKDCYRLGLHREPENDQVWRPLVGKKFSDEAAAMRAGSEWLGQNDVLLRAYPQALQTIDQLNQKIQALQSTPTQQEIQTLKDEVASLTSTINNLENKPQ